VRAGILAPPRSYRRPRRLHRARARDLTTLGFFIQPSPIDIHQSTFAIDIRNRHSQSTIAIDNRQSTFDRQQSTLDNRQSALEDSP
jgi:hypothetical protein